MTASTDTNDVDPSPSTCWCCGSEGDPEQMVHLGNHPEVALCLGCAHWADKQAWEIEDRTRTGPLVRARGLLRTIRNGVIDRGWHRHRIFGAPLRWLGNRLP